MRDQLLIAMLMIFECIHAAPYPILLPVPIEAELKVLSGKISSSHSVYQSKRATSSLSTICGYTIDQLKSTYNSFNSVDALLSLHFKSTNSSLGVLVILDQSINIGWVGIGFGRTMLDASFGITTFNKGLSTISVHDFETNGNYGMPKLLQNSNLWSINCTGTDLNGSQIIQLFYNSTVTLPQNIIWAYADLNEESSQLTKHDASGALLLSFTGIHQLSIIKSDLKWLHGYGMLVFVFLLHPLSVFNARYKPSRSWFLIHLFLNIFGAFITVITPILLAVFNYTRLYTTHGILGTTLLASYGLQFILGIVKRHILSDHLLKRMKLVHSIIGNIFGLVAVIQVGLGLQTMIPFEKTNISALWSAYFIFIIIWTLVFMSKEVISEVYEKKEDHLEIEKIQKVSERVKVLNQGHMVQNKATYLAAIETPSVENRISETSTRTPMLRYTWLDIDHAVSCGQNLIVTNHKEVYDITSWLSLHPGGQFILNTVSGTDVTNEFFALVPTPILAKSLITSNAINIQTLTPSQQKNIKTFSSTNPILRSRASSSSISPVLSEFLTHFTENDFVNIMKSRRTHQHTHAAFQKLHTFRIGDLIGDGLNFVSSDPNEYKRYVITDKKLITDSLNTNKVYKFRFCLINGDESERMVKDFRVGECIEIQCKIGKTFVSRYYTPITGNLTSFEIIVKINKSGQFSSFLDVSKTGDRQFKIRGGFGRELFEKDALIEKENSIHFDEMMRGDCLKQWMPDMIYFICAGTGISPFIQCINSFLMPIGKTQLARFDYTVKEIDELEISFGDPIIAHKHFMDGWSYGTNLRTKKIGIYPLSTTSLIHGIHSKFILINCSLEGQLSLFGFDLFHPALAAFQGEHIRVENIVQREKVEKNENLIGNLGFGRFNADFMQSIIQEEESGQVNSYHRKFFICGPSGFNDSCCDILLNDCQVPQMEVLILGNSTFVK